MHEENVDSNDAKQRAQPNPQPKEASLSKNRMSASGRFFLFVTFVLAGCGLTLAGFLYLQLIQDSPLEKAMVENDKARQIFSANVTDQLSSAQSILEKSQRELKGDLEGQIEQRLSNAEADLQTGLELVTASKPTTPNKWRLAEAGYLLREANRRLVMQRDTVFALRALTSAEEILQDLGDLAPFPLRAKLADDIASLKRIKVVDTEAVFIRLETLKDDVPNGLSKQAGIAAAAPVSAPQAQVWWQQILDRIKGLIRISKLVEKAERQELAKILPSQEVATLANLRIRLAIEQAQLGLLQEQEEIYKTSLLRAKATTLEYFDANGLLEMKLLANIQALLAIDLTPDLTDITGSLEMLSKAEADAE